MRVAENPIQVLIEELDPIRRSLAHLVLGRRAMDRKDLRVATEHLREAADLDPTNEVPRKLLEQIGSRRMRSWWPF